jgi:hypothetical protein
LGSFGYAPSIAFMALLTSMNPLAISDLGALLATTLSNDWRNGGEVGVEVACEEWRWGRSGC